LDRIKAILLRSEGWSISAIAQALRVHESTMTRHIKEYIHEQKLGISKDERILFIDSVHPTQAMKISDG